MYKYSKKRTRSKAKSEWGGRKRQREMDGDVAQPMQEYLEVQGFSSRLIGTRNKVRSIVAILYNPTYNYPP